MYADFAYGGVVADIIFVCILSHCGVVADIIFVCIMSHCGVVADIIFVCILSHCGVVAGNKNLLSFFPITWLQKTTH